MGIVEMKDTITAIATPPGRGGIGIVRITGPRSEEIARNITGISLVPRVAHFCCFQDVNQNAIDQGIAIFFKGPASYTGEDTLELYGHGGRVVLEMLLQRTIDLGARHARPGEFTERAFLNGKLDLLQAEAIADLIDSMSTRAARGALRSLEGEFSSQIENVYERVMDISVHVEGSLDFPEEEIETLNVSAILPMLQSSIDAMQTLLCKARQGLHLREGSCLVIAGKPNVGKSSLLNRLTGRASAIVSSTPGTTRDVIVENILLNGVPVVLTDTAGLRDTGDDIEQEGVRRAWTEIGRADSVLLVAETEDNVQETVKEITENIAAGTNLFIVRNKIDIAGMKPQIITGNMEVPEIYVSAITGDGIDELRQVIIESVLGNDNAEDAILSRNRHVEALSLAVKALEKCLLLLTAEANTELVAEELRQARNRLDEITGSTTTEELLDQIFSRFCIGK